MLDYNLVTTARIITIFFTSEGILDRLR